jgi:2-C-methyl-D-erythritol 2,4-cyclodiphosphate synthase
VLIPGHPGLSGHSDGDALIHAVIDALLGAAGLGDIGGKFPSDDARYAGIDSVLLLASVASEISEAGWQIVNLDATVITQTPRILPHAGRIRDRLAAILNLEPGAVNIKAKSTDQLGTLGRGEGLAAMAVALLQEPLVSSR